jgi:hypothetical protein
MNNELLIKIATDTAETRADIRNIFEHLAKLNGKVAAHETRLQAAEGANTLTAQSLATMVAEKVAAKKSWSTWLDKFLWAAVSILSIGAYRIIVLLFENDVIKKLIR